MLWKNNRGKYYQYFGQNFIEDKMRVTFNLW